MISLYQHLVNESIKKDGAAREKLAYASRPPSWMVLTGIITPSPWIQMSIRRSP